MKTSATASSVVMKLAENVFKTRPQLYVKLKEMRVNLARAIFSLVIVRSKILYAMTLTSVRLMIHVILS